MFMRLVLVVMVFEAFMLGILGVAVYAFIRVGRRNRKSAAA